MPEGAQGNGWRLAVLLDSAGQPVSSSQEPDHVWRCPVCWVRVALRSLAPLWTAVTWAVRQLTLTSSILILWLPVDRCGQVTTPARRPGVDRSHVSKDS